MIARTAEPIILNGICVDCDFTILLFPEANLPAYCMGILLSDKEKYKIVASINTINTPNNTISTILALPASLSVIIDLIVTGTLEIILTNIKTDVPLPIPLTVS
jgi:hypothetical protein